jgi:hypothetical protein
MKRILFVLMSGVAIMSCTEADNKSEGSNTAASTNAAVTTVESTAPNTSNVQAPQIDKDKITKVEWLDGTEKEFKAIKEGQKLAVSFRFKNVGDKPLIISDVTAGCGCTATDKPTKPYAPGETGEIKAEFNSENQGTGMKSKYVNVHANTDPQMTTLTFRVEVKPKPSPNKK